MQKKKIADLVDQNNNPVQLSYKQQPTIEDFYAYTKYIFRACEQIEDIKIQQSLSILSELLRVAYFCDVLQKGGELSPIIVKGNVLHDGKHRILAHLLAGKDEINCIERI